MITLASPPRPFSAAETAAADRWRQRLTPAAERLQHETEAFQQGHSRRSRAKKTSDRREFRRRAREKLFAEAVRAERRTLGVVELFILRWVIGQLIAWVMREWLDGKEDDDDSDADD